MARALIVVDVQNDFCEAEAWPSAVAPTSRSGSANSCTSGTRPKRPTGSTSSSWPPATTASTRVTTSRSNPTTSTPWPRHCVAGTDGVSFHPNLDPQPFDAIFDKGEYAAAYSGFEGKSHEGVRDRPTGCGTRA